MNRYNIARLILLALAAPFLIDFYATALLGHTVIADSYDSARQFLACSIVFALAFTFAFVGVWENTK